MLFNSRDWVIIIHLISSEISCYSSFSFQIGNVQNSYVSKDLQFVTCAMTGPAERHTSSNFCYVLVLIQVTSFHVGATRDLLQNTILIASGSFYHQFRTGENGMRSLREKSSSSGKSILNSFQNGNISGHARIFLKIVGQCLCAIFLLV